MTFALWLLSHSFTVLGICVVLLAWLAWHATEEYR